MIWKVTLASNTSLTHVFLSSPPFPKWRYQNIQRTIATERTEEDTVVSNRVERLPPGGGSDSEADPSQPNSGNTFYMSQNCTRWHSSVSTVDCKLWLFTAKLQGKSYIANAPWLGSSFYWGHENTCHERSWKNIQGNPSFLKTVCEWEPRF